MTPHGESPREGDFCRPGGGVTETAKGKAAGGWKGYRQLSDKLKTCRHEEAEGVGGFSFPVSFFPGFFSGKVACDHAAAAERRNHLCAGIQHGRIRVVIPAGRPEDDEIGGPAR